MNVGHEEIQLRLAPSLAEWPRLCEEIGRYCQRNGLPESLIASLQLAAEEWFANIVHHGYDDPVGTEVIEYRLGIWPASGTVDAGHRRDIRMIFRDRGRAFNPLLHPEPDLSVPLEQRNIGGLGIWLIKRTMDHCSYARQDDWNEWTMIKSYGG